MSIFRAHSIWGKSWKKIWFWIFHYETVQSGIWKIKKYLLEIRDTFHFKYIIHLWKISLCKNGLLVINQNPKSATLLGYYNQLKGRWQSKSPSYLQNNFLRLYLRTEASDQRKSIPDLYFKYVVSVSDFRPRILTSYNCTSLSQHPFNNLL